MKKQMKLNGLIAGSLMLALNAGAADDLVFPNKDSSGDISSAAAWGAEDFFTKNAVFDKTQTVTALADVSFAGQLKVTGGTLTLDMRNEATGADPGPRKMTFGGAFYPFMNSTAIVLRGGLWDLTSHAIFGQPNNYNNSGNQLTVTDGAIVTNVTALVATTYGSGTSHLFVSGGSRVYANTLNGAGTYGKDATVEISEGAKVSLLNADSATYVLQTETTTYSSSHNGVLISGEGTEVKATAGVMAAGRCVRDSWVTVTDSASLSVGASALVVGDDEKASNAVLTVSSNASFAMDNGTMTIGNNGRNAKVEVSGGASLAKGSGYLYLGRYAAASNAVLRIADNATVSQSGTVFLGYAAQGCQIEISDGATFESSGQMYVGGNGIGNPHNSLVVSGGTYTGPMPMISGSGAHHSLVKLSGADTRFQVTGADATYIELFGVAPDCSFVIDGAAWTNAEKAIAFGHSNGRQTHHCRLEIVNGGELVLPEKSFVVSTLDYREPSNTVYVGDASLLKAKSVALNSIHNTMIVSNGTVEATAGDFYVAREYQNGSAYNTNCCLVVQGETPRIAAAAGTLDVWRDSSIVFDLPADGYGDETPIAAKNIYFDATSHLEVRGGENYLTGRMQPVEKTLMTATDTLTLSAAQIAAANASLPKGLKLRKSADNKSLILKAGGLGMMLILR